MARIKYTALVESIRGTIAGTTFQKNAFGYTVKSKPATVPPRTDRQTSQKLAFQRALQRWGGLIPTDRGSWNTYATAFPVASRNNPNAYLTGFNLFVRHASLTYSAGLDPLVNPSGAQGSVVVTALALIRAGATFTFTTTTGALDSTWTVFIYLSRPLRPSQDYLKSQTIRVGTVFSVNNSISVDVSTLYEEIYGFLPTLDDSVGVDVTFVNTTNGQVIFLPSQILIVE